MGGAGWIAEREYAARQAGANQAALFSQAQAGLAGFGGLRQANNLLMNIPPPPPIPNPYLPATRITKEGSLREQLQQETNDWLKDI